MPKHKHTERSGFPIKTLEELRAASVPHCTFDAIIKVRDGEIADADKRAIDEYLYRFADPAGGKCVSCGEVLGGVLGTFEFGIIHGEGRCGECGWPARAVHRDVGIIACFEAILQYHPD
ncbi:MAG: hypothetical protein ABIL09_14095, partial [Gemmatimonadota bacterium]